MEADFFPVVGEVVVFGQLGPGFGLHGDAVVLGGAVEVAGLVEVVDFVGVDAHESAGGGVDGGSLIANDEDAVVDGVSLDGGVALHADDAVDDADVGLDDVSEVEDRLLDAPEVEHVFWPAVD